MTGKSLKEVLASVPSPPPFVARPELLRMGNIPKPMHEMAPRNVLGKAWWDKTRREAQLKTGFRCAACGRHRHEIPGHFRLEGHEVYSIDYAAGRMIYVETVPLCHFCHSFIHDGLLKTLVEQGKITRKLERAILRHGRAVLRAAGMHRCLPKIKGKIAEWSQWRLVIDGVQYPPKHATYEAWLRKFGRKRR